MGLSVGRSWSRLDAYEGNHRQELTNLLEIDFSNTPTKGLAWVVHLLKYLKRIALMERM
jgi:hypothetical protein